MNMQYEAVGRDIGALVDSKNKQYGNAFNEAGKILKVLYPKGIQPEQYDDILAVTRVLDKLFRVANGKQGQEDPWRDIAGYGILGASMGMDCERVGIQDIDPDTPEGRFLMVALAKLSNIRGKPMYEVLEDIEKFV